MSVDTVNYVRSRRDLTPAELRLHTQWPVTHTRSAGNSAPPLLRRSRKNLGWGKGALRKLLGDSRS